ncbi:MAG TPA: elongation factor Ts, partial [Candidatus Syntrophosphaera sp.]|nr:elongation factor Ts [Candidatus Syntrophosphaera sp.]
EIARNKAINEGKKPEIVEKIVEGTLKKFCSENALLEQELVNEPGVTVRDLINSTIAQTGENIQISRFVRYALGEE